MITNMSRVISGILCLVLCGCSFAKNEVSVSNIDFGQLSTSATAVAGFKYANSPRSFAFPIDHSAHEDYQIEWWYFTGNLETNEGRHFGYQLTIFRRGLIPGSNDAKADSNFATTQIYSADFAVTDSMAGDHQAFVQRSRGAAGLAGAQAQPFRVWVYNWSITGPTPEQPNTFKLSAAEDTFSIDLQVEATKPPIVHRPGGVSPKNADGSSASYYYSLTRMKTTGGISTPSGRFEVTGNSWMDHEFGTNFLNAEVAGWDWFAIQLADGTDVALGRIKDKNGSYRAIYTGSLIESNASHRILNSSEVIYEPIRVWRSAKSGYQYPILWKITIPSEQLVLEISAKIEDQELHTTSIYWEGAIDITGARQGKPITGSGYMEMTGAPLAQ
ncbi:MAG: carotenoid 1,2-hydratase [Anaerolineae bacterium]|nr:carotenoid 1,2-hydratase [Anaerolineae bacterium]